MRKLKIETMPNLESRPGEEWIEVPEGLHAKFVYRVDREISLAQVRQELSSIEGNLLEIISKQREERGCVFSSHRALL